MRVRKVGIRVAGFRRIPTLRQRYDALLRYRAELNRSMDKQIELWNLQPLSKRAYWETELYRKLYSAVTDIIEASTELRKLSHEGA